MAMAFMGAVLMVGDVGGACQVYAADIAVTAGQSVVAAKNAVTAGQTAVVDDADLLSGEEETAILAQLNAFSKESGWNLFVLTTNDAGGKTAQQYADSYVDTHAFEQNGICFLIDMDNREVYMSTTKAAIRVLTDRRIDGILKDGTDYVSRGEYAEGFENMIAASRSFYQTYQEPKRLTFSEIMIAIGIACAAAGITIAGIAGKYRLKLGNWSYDFRTNSRLDMRRSDDRLVNQFVTHHHIQRDTGGNSSGRSTTHHSSGGGTHGGAGRKF